MDTSFWKAKFEILLMALFVIAYSGFVLYGAIWNKQAIIDFANDNNKLFVGALLGALTGRAMAMASRASDKNGGNHAALPEEVPAPTPADPKPV